MGPLVRSSPRRSARQVALRCVAATAVAVAGSGCAGSGSPTAVGTPTGDPRQAAPAVRSGHLRIKVLTARCDIHVLSGTHDLLDAAGEFCRIRVRVESSDSSRHDFSTGAQRLVLADGQEL